MSAIIPPAHIDAPADGEVAMWRAVIRQALDDATLNDADAREFGRLRVPRVVQRERAKALLEAREWFQEGDEFFRTVCELAGVEPDQTRRWALAEIARFDRTVGDWRKALGKIFE